MQLTHEIMDHPLVQAEMRRHLEAMAEIMTEIATAGPVPSPPPPQQTVIRQPAKAKPTAAANRRRGGAEMPHQNKVGNLSIVPVDNKSPIAKRLSGGPVDYQLLREPLDRGEQQEIPNVNYRILCSGWIRQVCVRKQPSKQPADIYYCPPVQAGKCRSMNDLDKLRNVWVFARLE